MQTKDEQTLHYIKK